MSNDITVCLAFDFDAESAQIRQLEDPGRVSKGQFAIRRGIPRILSLLNKHRIETTFFVCGWVGEEYPELMKKLTNEGHEIAAHGYLHEYFDTLSIDEERDIIEKTTQILQEFTEKIKGFRAPYFKLSINTIKSIAEAGYIYDSSLMGDDHPYFLELPEPAHKLVEFPVEWFLDDWVIFEHHQHPPKAAFDIWKTQFDFFLEMEDIPENHRILNFTFHPSCIGHAYRMNVLDRLISHMKTKNVKFSRMDAAAEVLLKK